MRIALFTETFLPKVDGIVNTLCYLLEHLQRRGVERLLFAPHGPRKEYAGTPIIRYPGIPFPLYPELKLIPPFMPVRAELDRFRPDVVHVLNPVGIGLAGMRYARRRGIPVIASYHTDIPGYAARWGLSALRRPLWATLRWIHNRADLNLCPSEFTRRQLEQRGFANTTVWTRGVDTDHFHPRRRTALWRGRLTGGHPDAPLILFVSRLSQEKRAEWLLPVLEALPRARLAIVGDGPDRPRLERLFRGTPTVFTGFLRGDDLAHAYAAGDLFAFPAANETLGNVVLEAMASGLPVVGVNSGGPRELIAHGKNGLLCPPERVESFVEAVQGLVNRPVLARTLGTGARRYATGRSWQTVFDGLMADYRRLAGAARVRETGRSQFNQWPRTR